MRRYTPATKAKYTEAIGQLKEKRIADGQSHCRVQPAAGVFPAKEHKPELHARQDMVRAPNGCIVARRSMEKYGGAVRRYGPTTESMESIARYLGLNYVALNGFIRRNFPEPVERHNEAQRRREQTGT